MDVSTEIVEKSHLQQVYNEHVTMQIQIQFLERKLLELEIENYRLNKIINGESNGNNK